MLLDICLREKEEREMRTNGGEYTLVMIDVRLPLTLVMSIFYSRCPFDSLLKPHMTSHYSCLLFSSFLTQLFF